MLTRGRPIGSSIRQNIVELLYFLGQGYGYNLHKIYNQIFTPCTNEVIYYHLKKGVALNEFELIEIKTESGNYSWGQTVEKSYYKLGKNAKPQINEKVKEYFDKQNKNE